MWITLSHFLSLYLSASPSRHLCLSSPLLKPSVLNLVILDEVLPFTMDPAVEDDVQIKISTEVSNTTVTLTIVGPVPSVISRVASVISHTKPTSQSYTPIVSVNSNKSRIFTCVDEKFSTRLENGPVLVNVTYNMKDKPAIVTKVGTSHYILNYAASIVVPSKSYTDILEFRNSKLDGWVRPWTLPYASPKNSLNLNMAPPINSSPVQKSDHEGTTHDPFDYFLDKYFENLYLLTTPLTFFTKSVFARLKTLSVDDMKFYESILVQFLVKIDQFDLRHLTSNNGLLNSSALFEKEEIYRKSFIQKSLNLVDFDIHSADFQETNRSLTTILNNFKIREMHLQILIVLELIFISEKDDTKLFNSKTKKSKRQKTTLVGRRKKLATVISGGAISVNSTLDPEPNDDLTYNQLLDAYIDKLTINELLNASSETSAAKFINYVVVPFFDKKCPNSVKHMIRKIKGPSFKASNTKEKKRSLSQSSASSSTLKRPLLEKTTSSLRLEDIPELKMSLTRSNSDLQSLKRSSSFHTSNLSKRQVDMSIPVLEPKPLKRTSSSQTFTRVGKKITTPSARISASFSQVEATPMKSKPKAIVMAQTPDDLKPFNKETLVNSVDNNSVKNSVHSSSPVFERTPMQVSLQSPIAIRSTVRRPGDPIDLTERLMGSPSVRKNVKRRLFAPPPDPIKK